MQNLTHLIDAFERIGALTFFFACLYGLFTTPDARARHQTLLSATFEYFASTSAIGVIRRTVGAVGRLLGWVYGPVDRGGSFRDYFTLRAWQASFTIALVYVFVFPFLLVVVLWIILYLGGGVEASL